MKTNIRNIKGNKKFEEVSRREKDDTHHHKENLSHYVIYKIFKVPATSHFRYKIIPNKREGNYIEWTINEYVFCEKCGLPMKTNTFYPDRNRIGMDESGKYLTFMTCLPDENYNSVDKVMIPINLLITEIEDIEIGENGK